jgi:hypothetical protein
MPYIYPYSMYSCHQQLFDCITCGLPVSIEPVSPFVYSEINVISTNNSAGWYFNDINMIYKQVWCMLSYHF